GNRILLEEEFQTVGQQVPEAETLEKRADDRDVTDAPDAGAIRAGTTLDPSRDLALGERTGARQGEDDGTDREALADPLHERMERVPECDHGGQAVAAGWPAAGSAEAG